ncbi:MAG: response regulator transcription factor [Elusimicrobia bacterium]|nr:response regulator transcription factor [Elusimicrobiota bacterium]
MPIVLHKEPSILSPKPINGKPTGCRIKLGLVNCTGLIAEGLRSAINCSKELQLAIDMGHINGEFQKDSKSSLVDIIIIGETDISDFEIRLYLPRIRQSYSGAKIARFVGKNSASHILEDLILGIDGYLINTWNKSQIVRAILFLHREGVAIPRPLVPILIREIKSKITIASIRSGLSNREAEIFRLLNQGKRDKEIAFSLNISQNTVKTHVARVVNKLNARNRINALIKAIKEGWL